MSFTKRLRLSSAAILVLAVSLLNSLKSADASQESPVPPVTVAETPPPVPLDKPQDTRPASPGPNVIQPTADDATVLDRPAAAPPQVSDGLDTPTIEQAADISKAVAEILRDLVGSKFPSSAALRPREREVIAGFYAARDFAPLWIKRHALDQRAIAAIAHLQRADMDGLDPADYLTPQIQADDAPNALAEAELQLTASILVYARHAQAGRVHFSRIHSDIAYNLAVPEPADVLANVAQADDVASVLAAYNPPHAGYRQLREMLAKLRAAEGEQRVVRMPDGPIIRLSMQDARVPLLRERLGLPGTESEIYGDDMLEAVRRFQKASGIRADGLVGPQTVRALNGHLRGSDIERIVVNMERWRWMPRDLGESYSILNIPDFSMKVVRDGTAIWQTKVVVGKRSTPTPIMTESMKTITVNPTWNVPPTILQNEYLPALQRDPAILERMGIRVVRNQDGTIRMYQPPGDGNALGRLRFNFPNKFLVFQHDTPDRRLFNHPSRAYSNGCMRIQEPLKYAEIILSLASPAVQHTQASLQKMYGGAERNIVIETPFPVHLTYQTAFVGEAGDLAMRDDIYGYDAKMLAVLNGKDRLVADIAVPNVHRHPASPDADAMRIGSGSSQSLRESRPRSLFDFLFR